MVYLDLWLVELMWLIVIFFVLKNKNSSTMGSVPICLILIIIPVCFTENNYNRPCKPYQKKFS